MPPRQLTIVLDEYPHTARILSGELSDPALDLHPVSYRPVWDAFGAMVEHQRFDVSEMALTTYILARAAGKPISLLPVTMLARFQHPYIVTTKRARVSEPGELVGRRIGVRSYTQTTGAWMRGILSRQFDVEPDAAEWVTFESPHVAGYTSPPFVTRAHEGATMEGLLDDGTLSAAIISHTIDGVLDAVPLFPKVGSVTREWYEMTGVVQINHAVCVRDDLLADEPEVVSALIDLLRRGRDEEAVRAAAASAPAWARDVDFLPFGLDAFLPALDLMRALCIEQGMVRSDLTMDDLVPAAVRDIAPH